MKLDDKTTIGFPDAEGWANLYKRFRMALVNKLNHYYSFADREDAVEEAFHKLMHRKDPESYGENMPRTEAGWLDHLCWQARSYLSHMKDRSVRHAKYIEKAAKEMFGAIAAVQGMVLDAETRRRALVTALEILRQEQDVSRRDLSVYMGLESGCETVKSVCKRLGITANNVYQIRFRMKKLLGKYGPDCFRRAIRRAA